MRGARLCTQGEMAELCDSSSSTPSASAADEEEGDIPEQKFHPCSVHPQNHCDMFCETCEVVLCRECATGGGTHSSHECAAVADVFPKHMAELEACFQPIYDRIEKTNAALEHLRCEKEKIELEKEAVTREVREETQRIKEALEERQQQLIAKVVEESERKIRNLRDRHRRSVEVRHRLREYYESVQNMDATGSEMEEVSQTLVQQAREITDALKSAEFLEPFDNTHPEFVPEGVADLAELLRNFGDIEEYKAVICPGNCRFEGLGTKISVIGEPAKVKVCVVDQENREYFREVKVTFELVSKETPSTTILSGTAKRIDGGNYEITYQTTQRGSFQLRIKAKEIDITPAPLEIRSVLLTSGLNEPWGVSVCLDRGEVIVAESGSHSISVFDTATGVKLRSFGSRGNGPRQFNTPCGVAITPSGSLLVCDSNNHRIQLLSPTGELLKSVGSKGKKALQFNEPIGVGVHPESGKIYITEFRNNRVQILNCDLSYCGRFGQSGTGPGCFSRPYGVGFDSTGNVYVAERENGRIQVFSETGKHLQFVEIPSGGAELVEPVGVALDTSDNVYVSDVGRGVVEMFSSKGNFVRTVGRGCGQEQFLTSFGIAVDATGTAYISDAKTGTLQIV